MNFILFITIPFLQCAVFVIKNYEFYNTAEEILPIYKEEFLSVTIKNLKRIDYRDYKEILVEILQNKQFYIVSEVTLELYTNIFIYGLQQLMDEEIKFDIIKSLKKQIANVFSDNKLSNLELISYILQCNTSTRYLYIEKNWYDLLAENELIFYHDIDYVFEQIYNSLNDQYKRIILNILFFKVQKLEILEQVFQKEKLTVDRYYCFPVEEKNLFKMQTINDIYHKIKQKVIENDFKEIVIYCEVFFTFIIDDILRDRFGSIDNFISKMNEDVTEFKMFSKSFKNDLNENFDDRSKIEFLQFLNERSVRRSVLFQFRDKGSIKDVKKMVKLYNFSFCKRQKIIKYMIRIYRSIKRFYKRAFKS